MNERISLSFETVLRAFLRQDPEIILLGEIRDKQTADIAVKAALTGHLLLSSLHTNDALSTLTRLIDMGVQPYLITPALKLIIAQRLARKICSNCKEEEPFSLSERLVEENILPPPPRQVFTARGCAACSFSGTYERMGIYEVLRITPEIEEALHAQISAAELHQVAKINGFRTLQDEGIEAIYSGALSVAEYLRVIGNK